MSIKSFDEALAAWVMSEANLTSEPSAVKLTMRDAREYRVGECSDTPAVIVQFKTSQGSPGWRNWRTIEVELPDGQAFAAFVKALIEIGPPKPKRSKAAPKEITAAEPITLDVEFDYTTTDDDDQHDGHTIDVGVPDRIGDDAETQS